ncbi:MAG TPA: DUF1800 domain-containing protein [Bryobacteraceae bacterium]|nr:DUF1800 domain-containing protein [Bryobacteraceae bacterium]
MKRSVGTVGAAALAVVILSHPGHAVGPFEKRLSPDQQIVQALSRLTFGPRPGDIEEVRRIGLNRWIDQQLHPERISENPILEEKLKPLETLHLSLNETVRKYTPESQGMMMAAQAPVMTLNQLPDEDRRRVLNGTAEERTTVLKALTPEKRAAVLVALPPNILTYTPEFKEEAEQARKKQQEQIMAENRQRNPRLPDLLSPEQIAQVQSGDREKILAVFASLEPEKRPKLAMALPPKFQSAVPEYRREGQLQRAPRQVASEDAKEARVLRAVYSNRQLEEVLVDFWFNHFNVDSTKNIAQTQNLGLLLVGNYERDAIRPHVLGHFRDLLLATARHPAMLYYLDNWESLAPGSFDVGPFAPRRGIVNGVPNSVIPVFGLRQAHGLNENYGREVMELHTLGVKGGYTQQDVIAVARCFTGWTVTNPENPQFVFAPFMHDFGQKTVLGHTIPKGGGEDDGLRVIDILARHPSTAKFISMQLARHFVADVPPPQLVERMAQTFVRTDGDLRAVMDTLLHSTEFFSEGAWTARIKSPLEMTAGAVRAVNGDVTDAYSLVQTIADMGEALYAKEAPTGYPDVKETWLSTSGILTQLNFAVALASDQYPGVRVDVTRWKGMEGPDVARALLGRDASPQTLEAIGSGLPPGKADDRSVIASLILSSPDFERR